MSYQRPFAFSAASSTITTPTQECDEFIDQLRLTDAQC